MNDENVHPTKRGRNELRKNRRQPHSIAMENLHYVPKILDLAKDGAKVSAADVSIPSSTDRRSMYNQEKNSNQILRL